MKKNAEVTSTTVVHENPYYKVVREELCWPNGKPGTYWIVERPGFAIILALRHDDAEIAVVRQYRPTTRTITVELPCGSLNPGEMPEAAAFRELHEEMGHKAFGIETLPRIQTAIGMCRNYCYPFVVRDPIELTSGSSPEESEINSGLTHAWIPVTEWKRMIRAGEVVDGNSLAAWAAYREHRDL